MLDTCPICKFDCRGKRKGTVATLYNFPKHVVEKHPEVVDKLIKLEKRAMIINKQAKKETGLFIMAESYWSNWKDLLDIQTKEISD